MSSGGSEKAQTALQIKTGVYAPSVKCALSISQLKPRASIEYLDYQGEQLLTVKAGEQVESIQVKRKGTVIKVGDNGVMGIGNPVLAYAMQKFEARIVEMRMNLHAEKIAHPLQPVQAELEVS